MFILYLRIVGKIVERNFSLMELRNKLEYTGGRKLATKEMSKCDSAYSAQINFKYAASGDFMWGYNTGLALVFFNSGLLLGLYCSIGILWGLIWESSVSPSLWAFTQVLQSSQVLGVFCPLKCLEISFGWLSKGGEIKVFLSDLY